MVIGKKDRERFEALDNLKGELVSFLGRERMENTLAQRKESERIKPRAHVVYALREWGHKLAELQNRILDQQF